MAIAHPKNGPKCVFCEKWMGNANLVFKNQGSGFEFNAHALGTCKPQNNSSRAAFSGGCVSYVPSREALRIL